MSFNVFTANGRIEGPGSTTLAFQLTGPLGPKEILEGTAKATSAEDGPVEATETVPVPASGMPYALRPRRPSRES